MVTPTLRMLYTGTPFSYLTMSLTTPLRALVCQQLAGAARGVVTDVLVAACDLYSNYTYCYPMLYLSYHHARPILDELETQRDKIPIEHIVRNMRRKKK